MRVRYVISTKHVNILTLMNGERSAVINSKGGSHIGNNRSKLHRLEALLSKSLNFPCGNPMFSVLRYIYVCVCVENAENLHQSFKESNNYTLNPHHT